MSLEMYTLYHVTPRENFDSIMEFGVSPAFSRGRRSVIWLVDWEKLPWAMAHVSEKHDISVLRLLVLTVTCPAPQLRRAPWAGVYQSLVSCYPTNVEHAGDLLKKIEAEERLRQKSVKL